MDLRQLEVFESVGRLESFTRAAAEKHLVQSAVSATIAALERDLGTRLFDRSTRRVTPTATGRALLPHAVDLLQGLQAARDAVESVSGGLSGSLRIGYMTNVTLFDIPRLLARFATEAPAVRVHLSPAATGTAGLVDLVRSGDLDVAFVSAVPAEYPDLQMEILATSPLGLAVPSGHPLAARTSIRLDETTDLRFVDFREGFATRTLFDRLFREQGLRRDVRFETSDINDMAALVRNGLGVAFLSEQIVEGDPGIRLIPFEGGDHRQYVSLATLRGRTLSAAAGRLVSMAMASQPKSSGWGT